ncbi:MULTISPECIES: bifunctional diaminohydroxyphosphoribosylaminopyrimidine deaminase/5-amino-6-(5-phosphoribosylamino)uracil reductase RibD [Prevotella]|nr:MULTISPECIES: bifunctional diaminohydroxyphosphoribosylaminopyrimidine deaminase/5-amino-6-(5-phosphoribosylamino)uracil reductase RibD [Prevotella]
MENDIYAGGAEAQQLLHQKYMRRCLQLARNGLRNAKPNPMVGAVIVARDGRIIGEGYHVRHGEGHAEVNAFADVRPEDESLLGESTIYVSLEPCSHHGKTPPCADLIIHKGVRRCVCGCVDPFSQVQGRGIRRLRDAGIEVIVGILEAECLAINRRFITFNLHQRPYILLKWAQTADGFISHDGQPLAISTAFTKMLVHKLRTEYDAILIGRNTLDIDHPRLNVREWAGPSPERIVLSHRPTSVPNGFLCLTSIDDVLHYLYHARKQSLIVEGGTNVLQQFIDRGLWDEIRIETSPITISEGIKAPQLPTTSHLVAQETYDGNTISRYVAEKTLF